MTTTTIKKPERETRPVYAGDLKIGGGAPVSVQSMCATPTRDIEATRRQINLLLEHGADLIRLAVDGPRDVAALAQLRGETKARLVVDLQESYRLAEQVAPYVQKIRYNPGHLHHHEKDKTVREKVAFIVEAARRHECAIRIGVNFGSLDPQMGARTGNPMDVALRSVAEHIALMDELKFDNYLVSLKSSDPNDVIDINLAFSRLYPRIPLHLGVTEAGMLPDGETKTRAAFENLLAAGIGETIRVSLTLPYEEKFREILIARRILEDVAAGKLSAPLRYAAQGLNIISCPSCSRVENLAFVELAQKVRELSEFARQADITVAVMGCRVNGPGETDDADLGLWCAPNHVNFKRKGELLGAFSYEEILPRFRQELEALVKEQQERRPSA